MYRQSTHTYFYNIIINRTLQILLLICVILIVFYAFIYHYYLHGTLSNAYYEIILNFFVSMYELLPVNIRGFNKSYIKSLNISWAVFRFVLFTLIVSKLISIFVKTTNIITPEEFKSIQKINVLKGSSYTDYIKKYRKIPVENNSIEDIIAKMATSSEPEYWFDDNNVILANIKRSQQNVEVQTTVNPTAYDEITIAVNNNRYDILSKLNEMILDLQDDGSMSKICKIYLEGDVALNGCEI